MGLFHKKEACPVCGGEVKGLFHKKIGGKKALCKDCSAQVSMAKELLKDATPEFIKEHLEYRRENALKYNALHWEAEYDARGTKMGVDPGVGFLYLIDADMDDSDNPVVFSFDQITRYELKIEIYFNSPDDIYGFGGFGGDLERMCQVLKSAARREPVAIC